MQKYVPYLHFPLNKPKSRRVKSNVKAKLIQGLAGGSASLTMMSTGIVFAWINPVLGILLSPNSPVPMTTIQASWVASMPDIGTLFTAIPGGFIADWMGRKTLLIVTTPLALTGWIVIYFTSDVYVLMAARVLLGLAVGLWCTAFPLYISEITEPSVRGSIGNMYVIAFSMGQVYVYAIGPYVTYSTLAAVCMIPCGVFLLSFVWFHESPYYLLMKGKAEKAKTALHSFRGGGENEDEFNRIKSFIEGERNRSETWKVVFTTDIGRKAMFITAVVGTGVFLGGFTVMLSYSTDMFYKLVDVDLPPHLFTLIMGVLIAAASILSSVMLDLWGRRPLMLLSQGGNSICLMLATIYFTCKDLHETFLHLGLATVIIIIIASVMSLFGMCAINVYQAEVFSTSARGFGTGSCSFICGVTSGIALFMYIPLEESGYIYVNFIIYSLSSLFAFIIIYIYAPETRGETLEQIQDLLQHRVH